MTGLYISSPRRRWVRSKNASILPRKICFFCFVILMLVVDLTKLSSAFLLRCCLFNSLRTQAYFRPSLVSADYGFQQKFIIDKLYLRTSAVTFSVRLFCSAHDHVICKGRRQSRPIFISKQNLSEFIQAIIELVRRFDCAVWSGPIGQLYINFNLCSCAIFSACRNFTRHRTLHWTLTRTSFEIMALNHSVVSSIFRRCKSLLNPQVSIPCKIRNIKAI